jgi:hypothetical protein
MRQTAGKEAMQKITRRRFLGLGALTPLVTVGCRGGMPTIFGYQLGGQALYDSNISTIYVPVFKNRTFQTTPYRGFEVDITQAVIDQIGAVTPYHVVSNPDNADTELIGVLAAMGKQLYNRTQQNMVREGELQVRVDVVWRDLRNGKILSAPRKVRPSTGVVTPAPGDAPPIPFDPNTFIPPPADFPQDAVPTQVFGQGRYLPELGESNASAMARVQNRIATQIVSMMEKQWGGAR